MADLVLGQRLGQLSHKGRKLGVIGERQDGALQGCDEGREREVGALLVAFAHSEVVLEQGVHDAADAEGRLDYVGDDFLKDKQVSMLGLDQCPNINSGFQQDI